MSNQIIETDVCIVGAGFAGLYAGKVLKENNRDFVILEASDRVGGRTWTVPIPGWADRWIDKGGQWVGTEDTGQCLLPKLITDLGMTMYDSYHKDAVLVRNVNPPYELIPTTEHWMDNPAFGEVKAAVHLLEEMLKEIYPNDPWRSEGAEELDRQTFQAWLEENVHTPEVRQMMEANISYACADPQSISMLAQLAIIQQCGGFDSLDISAQNARVVGGMGTVAKTLSDSLGGRVLTGYPVTGINWRNPQIQVYTSNGLQVNASRVIVATPPTEAGRISYEPELTTARAGVTKKWPQGCVLKTAIVYETPFWRYLDPPLSGGSLDYTASAVETADSSTDEDTPGIMVAFAYARKARALMGMHPDRRRDRIVAEMVDRFGPQANNYVDYEETYWTDIQWIGGCYGAYLLPGATTEFRDAIREPVGPLHWAGSESSAIWPTFIEGALVSGWRAADEVLYSGG